MANNNNTKKKGVTAQTTTPKNNTTTCSFKDNSSIRQCVKISDWLFEKVSITNSQAHQYLAVISPATKILQIKKTCYQISAINDALKSGYGINYKCVARYLLIPKDPIERDNAGEVNR